MFPMMICLSAQNQGTKSSLKISELEKSKRNLTTIKTKKYPNPSGSLRGSSSKKIPTHKNLSKKSSSTKSIRISKLGKNQTPRHYKKSKSKFTKARSRRSSLCFTFHCAKVHWRKRRNVTIFWLSFIREGFLIKSSSRIPQNTWATQSWSWRLMTVCILGSLGLRYWRVDWRMESSFHLHWLTTWFAINLQSQSSLLTSLERT